MRLLLTCDAEWESRVDKVLRDLVDSNYEERFASRDYGCGLNCIAVTFVCRDPDLNFAQRVEFRTEKSLFGEENILYMDIVLNLDIMTAFALANLDSRKQVMVQQMRQEVPKILSRYDIPDFDREGFIKDFNQWTEEII